MRTPGQVFSGRDHHEYKPHKDALQIELEGLAISPVQWMEMLLIRTLHEPRTLVQHTSILYFEAGPGVALECVWECLTKRFLVSTRHSYQILHHLFQGPKISATER